MKAQKNLLGCTRMVFELMHCSLQIISVLFSVCEGLLDLWGNPFVGYRASWFSSLHTVGLAANHAGSGRKTCFLMYVYPLHLRLSKFLIFHGPIPANINGE